MRRDAIYARQSVEREDSLSIEGQLARCRVEAHEDAQEYIDRGFSGKNTNRPAFQRMMQDICAGYIGKVIVYRLDRISRSILDFAQMMELFEEKQVEFLSSTEHFDTSAPMGRAMLNICIVFAQLERETIQSRVLDTYVDRSRRGFYMGGRVPYGFALDALTLDGVRTITRLAVWQLNIWRKTPDTRGSSQSLPAFRNRMCTSNALKGFCRAWPRIRESKWWTSAILKTVTALTMP